MWTVLLVWASTAQALSPASVAALGFDDCLPALADPQGPQANEERVALARCQTLHGQPAQALATLAPGTGDLAPYAAVVAGEAHLGLGQPEAALARLQAAPAAGAAGRRAQQLRGEALVALERWAEARAALAPLLETGLGAAGVAASNLDADPAEVRWWLAQGALGRGAPDKAIPVLQRLWVANPTSPRSDDAAQALLSLGKPVENAVSSAGQALIRDRAKTFETLKLFPEAVALRDLLPKRSDLPSAGHTTARGAFDAKDYPRAVALYDAMPDKGPSASFHHALAASRTGDYARAADLYTALHERFPDHKFGDQASYKVGYLAYDAGDLDRAVPLLQAHLARYPKGNHGLEARWFIAWALYRQGHLSRSAAAFDELLAAGARGGLAAGAVYWKARIAGQQGQPEKERTGLERVLRSWPVSGYAWFASRRLQAEPPSPKPAPPGPTWDDPRFARGKALGRVGLGLWAREALAPLAKEAKKAGTQAHHAYAAALQAAGDFRGGQALVRSSCPKPGQGDPVLQRLCWPRPLGEAVSPVAQARALPPSLPFAIMTAESGLDPAVSSIAGARGLMQLMPFLGEKLFPEAFPERVWQTDLLFHPGMNTRLGVQELGNLMARYADRVETPLPMVIAGYNAGSEPVDRWLAAHNGRLEADVWAENIGYTETRKYVRRVLGYLRAYELVYGD